MGRLQQAPVRRPRGGTRLSVALHAPRRHLQQPAHRAQRRGRDLQVERLPRQRTRAGQGDDARHQRVHPPLPHPRPARRLPSHPPLRPLRQRRAPPGQPPPPPPPPPPPGTARTPRPPPPPPPRRPNPRPT